MLRLLVFLAALLLGSPAFAVQTNLGTFSTYGTHTTSSFTLVNAVSANTLVYITIRDGNANTNTNAVTDSKGNTYTRAISGQDCCDGANTLFIYASYISTGLTTSDTISYTSQTSTAATVSFSGTSATGFNVLDSAVNAVANNYGTSYTITGAATGAVSGELNICFLDVNATPSLATGWTNNPPNSPQVGTFPQTQVNSGTSALTCTGAQTTGGYGAVLVAFQPSGAVSDHNMLLLGIGR